MLKLIKLGIFVIFLVGFVSLVSIDVDAARRASSALECASDQRFETCGGTGWCLLNIGSQYDECCVSGSVGRCQTQASKPAEIRGCTDSRAENYNSNANINDGSCRYPESCTDNGQRSWSGCDASEPSCGQTTTGTQTSFNNFL